MTALQTRRTRASPGASRVSPALAPPPGHPRFPLVDALRAFAALAVVVQHAALISNASTSRVFGAILGNGNQGVAVFFIISGFLLYRPFVWAQMGGAPAPRVRDYLRRRVLRIVPAYWLALTVLALYPGLPDMFSHDWWRYYFLLSVYTPFTTLGGLFVAWSLCVEVSFYLALPLYALLVARLTRRADHGARVRREIAILAGLAVASIGLRLIVGLGGTFVNTLPAFLWWFALGMALALVSAFSQATGHDGPLRAVAARPGLTWAAAAVGYAGVCAVMGSPPLLGAGTSTMSQVVWGYYLLGGVTALLFVLPAVLDPGGGGWPRTVLGWRWLGWLGVVSYGIYLWHAKLLDLLAQHGAGSWLSPVPAFVPLLAAGLVAAVACAALSYYVVERPVLRLKERSAWAWLRALRAH